MNRDRMRVHMEATFNRTLESIFVHSSIFHQFSNNEYRPFLLNVWEDFCGYMRGDKRNMYLNLLAPLFMKNINFNHTCPYHPGMYLVKFDNVSVSDLDTIKIIPAGRYRLELSYHIGFKGPFLLTHKIYYSVSDHRIELF